MAGAKGDKEEKSGFQPSPRALGAAVLLMLALGVIVGSATNQIARNAGASTILVESPPPPAEEEPAPEPTSAAPEPETGGEEAAPVATPSAVPLEAPIVEEPIASEPEAPAAPIEEELPTGLPEVKHAFVIVLGPAGYEETFGETAASPFLKEELPAQGELLSNYYAVAGSEPANEIALLSGQGPTPATAAGCPTYGDVLPGTENPEGQVSGDGCVYPATTKTLMGQLSEAKLTWKAYREGAEGCPNPPPDATNPFLYFHGVLDSPECAATLVGLPQLATDLKAPADKFPALAYLSPAPETPADKFLELVVPQIKESLAYKDGGMIAITSSQAPQDVEAPDTSSCCVSPAFPNLPAPPAEAPATGPVKPTGGGGRVGLLLISPYIEPGTTSETYFNHFSLLATIEELFGLEKLGYAAEPAITGFDESIFNAGG
ncbi:MAG TPA: alkaline phosphatase family protein [Solirubrobacterales bacterium]|nr:alkaline phosphatase family protein [Solirubrobacterales bacterium]